MINQRLLGPVLLVVLDYTKCIDPQVLDSQAMCDRYGLTKSNRHLVEIQDLLMVGYVIVRRFVKWTSAPLITQRRVKPAFTLGRDVKERLPPQTWVPNVYYPSGKRPKSGRAAHISRGS